MMLKVTTAVGPHLAAQAVVPCGADGMTEETVIKEDAFLCSRLVCCLLSMFISVIWPLFFSLVI